MFDFENLFNQIKLPEIGKQAFRELHARLSDKDFADGIGSLLAAFEQGNKELEEAALSFAEKENINVKRLLLYVHLRLCEREQERFRAIGIPDKTFYETMENISDLCRGEEKKSGVYGIAPFDIPWFRYHFTTTLFQIGRLQYQIAKSEYDLEIDGISVKKGDTVIFLHIPGSAPFTPEICEESYSLALDFFKKYYGMDSLICFCYSWILQPWIKDTVSPHSNIASFSSTFRLLETKESLWHTFNFIFPNECDRLEDYPADTSVRRAALERKRNDKQIGYGVGVRVVRK